MVDDGEARELVIARARVAALAGGVERRHRLIGDEHVAARVVELVVHAVELEDVLLLGGDVFQAQDVALRVLHLLHVVARLRCDFGGGELPLAAVRRVVLSEGGGAEEHQRPRGESRATLTESGSFMPSRTHEVAHYLLPPESCQRS